MRTLAGMGIGAAVMYLLDPERGKRRRAIVSDKAVHWMHTLNDAADMTTRDVSNRMYGLAAEVGNRLGDDSSLTDQKLEARVRERLGGVVLHLRAITVTANAETGHVTLSGPILADEVDNVLKVVSTVRGVKEVENNLDIHESAEGVPALQGQPAQRGRERGRPDIFQQHWAPSTRLLAGTTGGVLALTAVRRRGPIGTLLGTVGTGLVLRAITNREVKNIVGIGAGRNAVTVRKTVTINAPIERVFAFWDNFENFPRFMSHLEEVRDTGGGRSHWVAEGPGGVPVGWDAEITQRVPNELVAWKSVPGSAVNTAGTVRFEQVGEGRTRVDIHFHYTPPVGAIGHTVAKLFASDPKAAMDEDLARVKSLLEEHKTTADGQTVTGEDMAREIS